ncbi:MAG: FG-GAP repeat protein, partial [Gammaproteobacteria bacterium]|nr:FG-GAP repeat protein [Gammaproteobacteria bacterium]
MNNFRKMSLVPSLLLILFFVSMNTQAVQLEFKQGNKIPDNAMPVVLDAISDSVPQEYQWTTLLPQKFEAKNKKNSHTYQVSQNEFRLKTSDNDEIKFNLVGYGYKDRVSSLIEKPDIEILKSNKLNIRHSKNLDEWFVNSPFGLEHGYTLHQPPVTDADTGNSIVLAIDVSSNLSIKTRKDGKGLIFNNGQGHKVLGYDGLTAFDSTDRILPVTMSMKSGQLLMQVDTKDAVYPITVDPLFSREIMLDQGADEATDSSYFGYAVAMDGDWLAVGAYYHDHIDLIEGSVLNSGAVFMFKRNANFGWDFKQKVQASNMESSSYFGFSISINDNKMVVGSPYKDRGTITDAGSVYVYTYAAHCDCWTQSYEISLAGASDRLGYSVDIFSGTIIAGAVGDEVDVVGYPSNTGALYFCTQLASSWVCTKNVPATALSGDNVGYSVAIKGNNIIAGAPTDDAGGTSAGRIYFYKYIIGVGWQLDSSFLGVAGDQLGYSVDIDMYGSVVR